MTEIKIKIPSSLYKLIKDSDDNLYIEAIHTVARKKLLKKRRELNKYKRKIAAFEKKYGCSYTEFAQNMQDTVKAHDDWIEWTYLQQTYKELSSTVAKLDLLLKNK